MQLHILNCTFIFWYFLLVQNVISWSVYFTLCWPSVILRSEEWRNENILRVSREHVSSREVLYWNKCPQIYHVLSDKQLSIWWEKQVLIHWCFMIYVIVSWIEPALPWPLVFVAFGDMFSPKTRKSAFLEKSQKNKKCLKVFEKVLKYNCSIGKRYHSHPRLFVCNVKVPQKRVNRLGLKNVSLSF